MAFFGDTSKWRVRGQSSKELAPEDIFWDGFLKSHKAGGKKEEPQIQGRLEVPLNPFNLTLLLGASFSILFLYLIFVFWLQIPNHSLYANLSQANREGETLIRPLRGLIFDAKQDPLVENIPSFNLMLNVLDLPSENEEKEKVISRVSSIMGISSEEFFSKISELKQAIFLAAENLPHGKILQIEEALEEIPGFYLEKSFIRHYPKGDFFSHILGYIGRISAPEFKLLSGYGFTDYIGKDGIELYYENLLRGVPGKILIERDALGKEISKRVVREAESGKNITLWLESNLQEVLGKAMQESLNRIKAERGSAVALDPKSGGIKALISLPSYDNNLFSAPEQNKEKILKTLSNHQKPLFNRAISGQYLTGSAIKPFIAAAALTEIIISPKKLIDATLGYIDIPNEYNPEIIYRFHDWRPHGWVDMRRALAVSSNVYFYTIGGGYKGQKGLGPNLIKKYLSLFGWGSKTGVDLPGEADGFLPDPAWKQEVLGEPWSLGNTYHYAIGQGYLRVTPLQLAAATTALANNGKLFRPQAIKSIGQEEILPQVIRENFIDLGDLKTVREGMREAVEYGSAVILNDLPLKAAAKTGTAQTADQNKFHHWVTVFAPYDNPEIVLTIIIEDVEGLQSATLPVARQVLQWYFSK